VAQGDRHPLDPLVEGIRERSPSAFHDLYRETADRLAGFAFRILRDRQHAEDAVQQAFLELTQASSRIRGDGKALEAWLYRSVRFSCLDHLRAARRRPEDPTDQLPEIAGLGDHEIPDPDLEQALSQLTGRQRAILHLRHVEGMSGEEVAEALGINRMAVYAAVARAEARLRRLLPHPETIEVTK
jgi:RNA polymerase sigma-70 factor (ECF subfamily)